MIKYQKTMTRDAPLVMIEAWYKGYTDSLNSISDVKFPEPIYIFNDGTVESWRATDFFKEIPKRLSVWVKESLRNTKRVFTSFEKYKKCGKKILRKKKLLRKNLNSRQALEAMENVIRLFVDGVGGLIFAYWCVVWNDEAVKNHCPPLFPKKLLTRAVKLREKDALFDDACDFSYHCLCQIAKNERWPRELMRFSLLSELKNALKDKKQVNFQQIQARKDGYGYFKKKLFLKKDFKNALAKHKYQLIEEAATPVKQLTGVSASRGKVRGRVAIVMNREQLKKMSPGDVLVAPMTTPWYLPAMKKAAAFVTDEGGIICHAAIIAREMKKPCIVGTKIATRVLRDGQMVEVDANQGIVRVLK